jgi:hypothetical protein
MSSYAHTHPLSLLLGHHGWLAALHGRDDGVGSAKSTWSSEGGYAVRGYWWEAAGDDAERAWPHCRLSEDADEVIAGVGDVLRATSGVMVGAQAAVNRIEGSELPNHHRTDLTELSWGRGRTEDAVVLGARRRDVHA